MVNVFIIGSKGVPAKYGGFETFVDNLLSSLKNDQIKFHISCLSDNDNEFNYKGARCFNVDVPKVGSASAVIYDLLSMRKSLEYIKENSLENNIIYVLACRIGPFMWMFKGLLRRYNVKLFVNPDGHEWKRSKWNTAIKKYWKLSERLMVKESDLLVCDSKGIENYIQDEYKMYNPNTTFISYGATVTESLLKEDSPDLQNWLKKHDITPNEYYLIVGRFVPENNYELMIREFILSDTKKDLIIISNVEENDFYRSLIEKTQFVNDKRIKFVGTIYDQDLLKKIRELAFGYIHGHEVGGTNPSLLEALASTNINILLDVIFNKEVGGDSALYFTKEVGSLKTVIFEAEQLDEESIRLLSMKAKSRIYNKYSWNKIASEYENLFLTI